MDASWLTLRDIQYLLAVAEHTHFGKAAKASHVSQPALSTQIRKFEERLGVKIFERSNKKVMVTPIGENVLKQARALMANGEALLATARAEDLAPLNGEFRLGAIATVGPYLLPKVLGPIRKEYPDAKLYLTEGLTDSLIHQLRLGLLDAVIASPTFNAKGLKAYPLYFEQFYLALPKQHELEKKSSIHSTDLNAAEMVLLQDGHCLTDQALGFCAVNRRGNIRQGQATSLETLRHLVATGIGYTLVPWLAVNSDRGLKNLVSYRQFSDRKVGRKVVLYCREGFARIGDVDSLAALIHGKSAQFISEA
jgi:LysR family hydrogen peroxide-inducible transcriptional activator